MAEQQYSILDYRGLGDVINNLNTKYIKKYSKTNLTLYFSNWSGDSTPYTYEIPLPGVTETSDVQIIPNYDWTTEQVETWMNASILSGETGTDIIRLKSYGVKPTINIPITIMVGSNTN